MSIEEVLSRVAEERENRFYGKYRGIVSDNQDPNNLGRIKVNVPEVLGDIESGWALPCLPYSGDGAGLYMIPEPGAGVWVEFEGGDPSRPIWSGCWWDENTLPKDNSSSDAKPALKIIRSQNGLMATFDDSSDTITVSDQDGSNMLEIKVQSGNITVKSTSKAIVDAPAIELVDGAGHPLVFGDRLLEYLKRIEDFYKDHQHLTELCLGIFPVVPAPPVIPFIPATRLLVSNKVTTD